MDAKLRSDDSKRTYRSNIYGLTLGTVLILASMAIGAFLLFNGKYWSGSLFSVPSVIALFFRVFVNRRDGSQKNKRPA
jgi:membrane protein implicated in regulation of membrane protease activity